MYQAIEDLDIYLRGWVSYFRIQEFRMLFRDLDGWIRSRLRSMQCVLSANVSGPKNILTHGERLVTRLEANTRTGS